MLFVSANFGMKKKSRIDELTEKSRRDDASMENRKIRESEKIRAELELRQQQR